MNNKYKNIGTFIFVSIAIMILSIILAYVPMSLILYKKFVFSIDIFKIDTYWLFAGLFATIFMCVNLYFFIKFKFFSANRLMLNNDRTKSNLFDNQSFMSNKELFETYGNYEFSTLKNSKNSHGYVINSYLRKNKLYLSMYPSEHAMLIGATGTGKSYFVAGTTIQANAMSAEQPSMIINDLAGDLYLKNSLFLQEHGYNVSVIDLRNPRKTISRFNPCSIIWDLYHQYRLNPTKHELIDLVAVYINELAYIICPEATGDNANWANGARGILIGCFWGMLEDSLVKEFGFTKDMFTIVQVSNIVNRQKEFLMDFLFARPQESKVFDYAGTINDNKSEKTVDSYISHLVSSLTLFLESGMQYITSATDIDVDSISKKPTALFVIIPAEMPSRAIIGTMIYTQLYNYFAHQALTNDSKQLDRTVYYILDEFGNLPKIKDFASWLTTSRKMKIFFFIMLQSITQLEDTYGKDKAVTICDNCSLQMFLGSASDSTIDYFQKKLGTYTAIQRNMSLDTSDTNVIDFKGQTSLTKKDLVNRSEFQQIKQGEMYAFILRKKPIHTTLVPTFNPELPKTNTIKLGTANVQPINADFRNKIYDLQARKDILFFESDPNVSHVPPRKHQPSEAVADDDKPNQDSLESSLKFLRR